MGIEVFIRVIRSISNGCHSVRLNFESDINQMCVTAGHIQVGSVSHGSVEDQLFKLSGLHQLGVG